MEGTTGDGWTALGRSRWATTRDGRRLHHVVLGEGAPTAVFESGMGASRCSWGAVAPEVASRATAVVYDRAGLGRSPRDARPRTLDRAVDDLEDLLIGLDAAPFVLVGHSYGGPIVRALCDRRPDLVAGVVLVDQTDEDCPLYFEGSAMQQQRSMVRLMPWAARVGLLRLVLSRAARRLPTGVRAELAEEDGSVEATRAMASELEPFADDLSRLRDHPLATPAVPVTLITGTAPARFGRRIREGLLAAHVERANALPRGRHVEAPRSGHLIPLSEPGVVAAEVLRLVDEAR